MKNNLSNGSEKQYQRERNINEEKPAMYENGIARIAGENVENGSAAIENGNKWPENESGVENNRKFFFFFNFKFFFFAARIEE
jgi:hypothetical protein